MQPLLEPIDSPLAAWLSAQGLPAYRGAQIRKWLFEKRAADWEAMTDLPKTLRGRLEEEFCIFSGRVVTHRRDEDGTEKLLLEWRDAERVECVLLRDGVRRSICISTQVGCGMGCVFCASGLDGVTRNLTAGEIVEQMLRLAGLLPAEERISHVVVMGMGEPLANLDNLLPALREASAPDALGISPRRITISTVGLPKAIDRLTQEGLRYNLAVSLHASDNTQRGRLVRAGRNIPLADIMQAADRYFESSGRRLTFEYVLLAGENDSADDARRLAKLLAGRGVLLNVIPYNPVAGLPYRTPSRESVKRFGDALESAGVNIQVRQRKGAKIDAACGQLRRAQATTPAG